MGTRRAAGLIALLLAGGCRAPQPCVAVSSPEQTGKPVKRYDEFTRVSTIISELVLTPDQEWTLADQRDDGLIHWGIGVWLRGSSAERTMEIAVRVSCQHPGPEESSCIDCDELCNERTGRLELLADGQPLALPAAQFRRIPVPTPEGGAVPTATLLVNVDGAALAPLEYARHVKLRVCGAIVATLTAVEAAHLRELMRHHRAMIPPR